MLNRWPGLNKAILPVGTSHGIVNQACFQLQPSPFNISAMGYKGLEFEDIIVTLDGAVAVVILDRASE